MKNHTKVSKENEAVSNEGHDAFMGRRKNIVKIFFSSIDLQVLCISNQNSAHLFFKLTSCLSNLYENVSGSQEPGQSLKPQANWKTYITKS